MAEAIVKRHSESRGHKIKDVSDNPDYWKPDIDLIITNWLHYDCIKEVYNVEVFSDEYFSILKKHFVSQIETTLFQILVF